MRIFAFILMVFAVVTQGATGNWTSRELVLKATQTFAEKLNVFQSALKQVNPSAALADQWRAVRQKADATEALADTGAEYDEVFIQFKQLGVVLSEARRLMHLESICYHPKISDIYQATRLAFRRLDRNMSGLSGDE